MGCETTRVENRGETTRGKRLRAKRLSTTKMTENTSNGSFLTVDTLQ